MAGTKNPVFRVTGLPASQGDDRLSNLLRATIAKNLTGEESLEIVARIDIVPSCYRHDERVALVEFRGAAPAFLSELTENPLGDWQVEMDDTDINFDQHFFGFTQLYNAPADSSQSVTADIIAIPGLNSHAYGSWRGKGNLKRMWLRDFLRKDMPRCRTMIYGYNSSLSSHGIETITDFGRLLLEELKKIRDTEKLQKRPLIFIAHSFGGIILAHVGDWDPTCLYSWLRSQCLVKAVQTDKSDHPTIASLHKATYGMLLFGISHKGLVVSDLEQMLDGQNHHPRGALLGQIKPESVLLPSQLADFKNLIRDRKVVSFYETHQTRQVEFDSKSQRWKRMGHFVTTVDTKSSLLELPDSVEVKVPIQADHTMMVKFDKMNDAGYCNVKENLEQFEREAPDVVARRFQNDPSGNMHWMVPRTVNSRFIGRAKLLDRIQQAFDSDRRSNTGVQHRFVITGMGGLGKSEICLKVAGLLRESFWGVFWVDVSSVTTATNDYVAVAKMLGLSAETVDEGRQALANAKRRWLLILDSADDPRTDYQTYIPAGTEGAIIITSRVPASGQYSTVGHEELDSLGPKESTNLLLRAAAIDTALWPSHQKQAQDIVELLGSHTLALIQAGAYVAEGFCRLDQYPEKYERRRKSLLEHYPEQEKSRYGHVYATFEASIDVLSSCGQVGQDALDLLGVLANVHYILPPLQLFKDAWSRARKVLKYNAPGNTRMHETDNLTSWHVSQLPNLVGTREGEWDIVHLVRASNHLVSLSLVARHDSGGLDGLSMHPLVHAWAKDRLEKARQRQTWTSTGCLIALSRNQSDLWEMRENELRPHIQAFLSNKTETISSYGTLEAMLPVLLGCGWILSDMREDERVARLLDCIYAEYQITPSEPAEAYLSVWSVAASNLCNMGKIKSAVALQQYVGQVRETILPEDHNDRLCSQHALADVYRRNGQIQLAVALLEDIVKVRDTALRVDDPDRLASQKALAVTYKANGQVKEAVALLEQVIKVYKTTVSANHPRQLASQHELAGAYLANGQIKEAVPLLEHVVKVRTTLAENHPSRLASQHELACAYLSDNQVPKALALLEHIVQVENSLAEDNPTRLVSQYALAHAYLKDNQVQKALELLEHIVQVENSLAEDNPTRLVSQHTLARARWANGQVKEAVVLMEHVVQAKQKFYDCNHRSRIISEKVLKSWYAKMERRPA